MFHAKTKRRKKQRVAASADLGSEVPNLGVARALFVILVLHVAAIAAIFIHNRVTDDSLITTSDRDPKTGSLIGESPKIEPPVIREDEEFYLPNLGDTFESIARAHGVKLEALRALNGDRKLKTGDVLRIPARTILVVPPIEDGPIVEVPKGSPIRTSIEHEAPFESSATVVKPNVTPAEEATTPVVVAPRVSSGRTYTVKDGDSLWRIARRHKVALASLLKTNGITNAKTLRIGMTLRIPGN